MRTLLPSLLMVCCVAFIGSEARNSAYYSSTRPSNLACPQAKTFFRTTRSEPRCRTNSTCDLDELCCDWFGIKHCLKALDTTPKDGRCPVGTVNPDEACRLDFVGCQFDSECGGNQKCCKNVNCGYNQCQAPQVPRACTLIGCRNTAGPNCKNVELIQPNGPECQPICRVCRDEKPVTTRPIRPTRPTKPVRPTRPTRPTPPAVDPRGNLGCPRSPFFFPVQDTDPACKTDSDCEADEKCCFFGRDLRCKKGLITTPKPGSCPNTPPQFPGCIADFAGCQFDSECRGTEKCCRNSECGYSECRAQETVRACTEIGCGPQAGPDCRNVELVRPNGPGCEPVCRVCRDPPPPPKPQPTPSRPIACTRIGCGRQAGPDCKNVQTFRPNGPECGPVCTVCRDRPVAPTSPPRAACRWVDDFVCRRNSSRCRMLKRWMCKSGNNTPAPPNLNFY